jgi:hypothetical protein
VRTLVVEDLDKLIKAGLLLEEIPGRRLGGFFFQGEMHALVTAILVWVTRLDAFDAHAQPQPPHGKLAQVKQSVGGSEGYTVVATDVGGQAALLKKPLKYSESVVFAGGRKRLTGEEKAAGVIGDREERWSVQKNQRRSVGRTDEAACRSRQQSVLDGFQGARIEV